MPAQAIQDHLSLESRVAVPADNGKFHWQTWTRRDKESGLVCIQESPVRDSRWPDRRWSYLECWYKNYPANKIRNKTGN